MPQQTQDLSRDDASASTELAVQGLSSAEVAKRVAAGQVNTNTDVKTKSVPQILAEHTFTLFNAVMLGLAIVVFSTGELRNALFIFPALLNIFIGAFQEIRSKRAIDRLSVLAASDATVIRDGQAKNIPLDRIVLGDVVRLGRGDQVPADARIVSGEAAANESMLTGESVSVDKRPGDELLSGSFLDSGSVLCEVVRVGADGYAAKINAEAKQGKKVDSEILNALRGIIRISTILLVPIGAALFVRTFGVEGNYVEAVLSSVSAVVGMIPQGLVLLTSSVFAIAATRLAAQKVLVQQLYCTEKLARVDVLCLDKTGTITSGDMRFEELRPVGDCTQEELAGVLACLMRAAGDDTNDTSKAIAKWVGDTAPIEEPARHVSFSSATKYSGCVTVSGSAFVLGAAQFVLKDSFAAHAAELESFGKMSRVLVVCEADGFDDAGIFQGDARLLGYISLVDEIRSTAPDTIAFFKQQGVQLKVISGDDPHTVSEIAKSVGIPNADKFVDATTLDSAEKIKQAAEQYSVFGRVTPEQKRELMRSLKAAGHTVAMTGDGVNDVLALREADCSVAMASGSDAARNIAELVLVDNDFAHMPEVVAQGRQSINNLERSASLFLVKTVFSALLALICVVWPPYPFLPVQMTLLSAAVIGVPSFVLALEPNHERVTGRFMKKVLSRSLPASIAIVVCVSAAIYMARTHGWSEDVESTLSMYLVAAIGLALIVRISLPLNAFRGALIVVVLGIVVVGTGLFGEFFSVVNLDVEMWEFLGICAFIGLVLFQVGYRVFDKMLNEAQA